MPLIYVITNKLIIIIFGINNKRTTFNRLLIFKNTNKHRYPWAFYYLFCLQDILDNMYKPEWLNSTDEFRSSFTELDIQLYRAVLSTFVSLMWKNLQELFGKDFETLYTYFINKDGSGLLDRAYLTGICNYLVADNCEGLGKVKYTNFKRNILLVLAYVKSLYGCTHRSIYYPSNGTGH